LILLKELDRRAVGSNGNKTRFALFECEHCGKQVEKQKNNGLRDFSCGCARYELTSKSNAIHGDSNSNAEYYNLWSTWRNMRDRCNRSTNQDYQYYGGKGIVVCNEWNDYLEFKKWSILNDYTLNGKLQIDRIDGNKDYSPDNCRWVDAKTNQRNRDCIILNEEKANEIRTLIYSGLDDIEISKMYKVHKDTIRDIRTGRTWN
jgi:hypothetical protein